MRNSSSGTWLVIDWWRDIFNALKLSSSISECDERGTKRGRWQRRNFEGDSGEDPATGLNDLKTLMRNTLREILPELLGKRGGGDRNTDDPPRRPGKIHPGGRKGPSGSMGMFSVIRDRALRTPHSMLGVGIWELGP